MIKTLQLSLSNAVATIAIVVAACASSGGNVPAPAKRVSLKDLVSSNQSHLLSIELGETKGLVMASMGAATATTRDGAVNNPWASESFTDKEGAEYEVLYYLTKTNVVFLPLSKSLTTPIVFKGGKVIGWGCDALQRATADIRACNR